MTEPAQRRVLICGDRNWTDYTVVLEFVKTLPPRSVVIEGDANGADIMGARAAQECWLGILHFPANWREYGRAAGPIRNKQMLDEGRPTEVHAFHDDLPNSKGTKNMLAQARKYGIPCWLHSHEYPGGIVVV